MTSVSAAFDSLALSSPLPKMKSGAAVVKTAHLKTVARDFAAKLGAVINVAPESSRKELRAAVDAHVLDVLENDPHREEAFFVVNLRCIYDQYVQFVRLLPRVRPYYAVKCNPATEIVGLLHKLGCGFDCASAEEMRSVLQVASGSAFSAEKDIIFANPCKMRSHISTARHCGVRRMTFDSLAEVDKIAELYPDAELVLRVITDDSHSRCRFSVKFGAPLETVPRLVARCIERGVRLVGVSFHVGSGCGSADSFAAAVESARQVFDVAIAMGVTTMRLVDVGGGFPGSADSSPSFPEIAAVLGASLDKHFPAGEGYELIAEPGRYFVSESHVLAANVHSKRLLMHNGCVVDEDEDDAVMTSATSVSSFEELTSSSSDELEQPSGSAADSMEVSVDSSCGGTLYYLNEGTYHAFNCVYFDHYSPLPIPIVNMKKRRIASKKQWKLLEDLMAVPTEERTVATIFGPTCDSLDCIAKEILMPKMNVGEWMMFRDMGAYTVASSTAFNGFQIAERVFCWLD